MKWQMKFIFIRLNFPQMAPISLMIQLSIILALSLGALAYAELGTMNTSSGAEWAYFMDAFGSAPAFLFSWVSTLVLKPSQMAIICLSFAQYGVEAFVSECDPPPIVVKMVALLAIGKCARADKLLNNC
jgi:L-type amino acid transporter 9